MLIGPKNDIFNRNRLVHRKDEAGRRTSPHSRSKHYMIQSSTGCNTLHSATSHDGKRHTMGNATRCKTPHDAKQHTTQHSVVRRRHRGARGMARDMGWHAVGLRGTARHSTCNGAAQRGRKYIIAWHAVACSGKQHHRVAYSIIAWCGMAYSIIEWHTMLGGIIAWCGVAQRLARSGIADGME